MVTSVQEHFKNAEAKRKKEFLQSQKNAKEAEKRIGKGFNEYSKKMHEILDGGDK